MRWIFLDAMIDGWVESQIVMVIGQMPWLGPLLALIAGVLAAFTPLLPVEHTVDRWLHQRARRKNNEAPFFIRFTFAGGTACTFVALGLIATSVGHLLGTDSG